LYCGVEGCVHFTKVKDYGIWPMIYRKFSDGTCWLDIYKQFFVCAQHYRAYKYRMSDIPEKKGPWVNNITKTINHPEFPEK
jgi:hypothetical protein